MSFDEEHLSDHHYCAMEIHELQAKLKAAEAAATKHDGEWLVQSVLQDRLVKAEALEVELSHEISYYESLVDENDETDWPHRDGRFRDWLQERLKRITTHEYAIGQHDLICEALEVGVSPDDPGDTAFEAVVRLQQLLTATEAARDRAGDLLHECTRDLAESERENAKLRCRYDTAEIVTLQMQHDLSAARDDARERLVIAKELLREACGSVFPMDDDETNYRILVPRQWYERAKGACGE